MKSEKKIFISFLLNLFFSAVELVGGLFTGSIAIISDSVHDFGDAMSIGISWLLERKSTKKPDNKYTYGYMRFSVLGSVITTAVLIVGSILVMYSSIRRIINPVPVNYDGMIWLGVFGTIVNLAAALLTRNGESLNQKAVNLHMLEDVLGWIVVLIGAVIMRFTDLYIIDPILSLLVAVYIFACAVKNVKEILDIFLIKIPEGVELEEIKSHLMEIDGVINVHHIHIWSMDGIKNYATLHVVTDREPQGIKEAVKDELKEHNIIHVTVETERPGDRCPEMECNPETARPCLCHHH